MKTTRPITKREFVRSETEKLGSFLHDANDPDGRLLVKWGRSYRCDCGFTCSAPAEIFDHWTQPRRCKEAPGSLIICPGGCKRGWVRVQDGPEDTSPDLCHVCDGKGLLALPMTASTAALLPDPKDDDL